MMSDQLAYGIIRMIIPWKIYIWRLSQRQRQFAIKTQMKMHITDNSDITIEKSSNGQGQGIRKVRRVSLCQWVCHSCGVLLFFALLTLNFFDILCRSRSVTNIKDYESMTQWVTTTLPRGAPCCLGSPLVVKVGGGEQASSLWWCCCARSPPTGENHLSRIFSAHHQPAPSPHNDLHWENVNSVLVSSNGKANNSQEIMYLQTCESRPNEKKMSWSKNLHFWDIDL